MAFVEALDRYVDWVEKSYGQLNMRGIERREQRILSLTLDDVYVSLAAVVSPERKEGAGESRIIDMSGLLAMSSRLVITGGPGSGKTTYLYVIASTLASALRGRDIDAVSRCLGLSGTLPLPIYVSLSEYNRYRRERSNSQDPRQGTLIAFISHSLIRQESTIGLPDDFFERLLIRGRACILLLDGLDEVADERERLLVRQAVQNVANNDGVRQIVVTSRARAYQGDAVLPEVFRIADVQPMTSDQVNMLAARWCRAAYSESEVERETARLQQAIANLEQLRAKRNERPLVDTPLLVTIVAIVHYNEKRLQRETAAGSTGRAL